MKLLKTVDIIRIKALLSSGDCPSLVSRLIEINTVYLEVEELPTCHHVNINVNIRPIYLRRFTLSED